MTTTTADFDGKTFAPALDGPRLSRQLDKVRDLMLDGKWRKLRAIQDVAGGSEAAISARLRDLRKPKFGSYTVERRRAGDPTAGSWEYRVLPPIPDGQPTLL